jgi:hypothetical protein
MHRSWTCLLALAGLAGCRFDGLGTHPLEASDGAIVIVDPSPPDSGADAAHTPDAEHAAPDATEVATSPDAGEPPAPPDGADDEPGDAPEVDATPESDLTAPDGEPDAEADAAAPEPDAAAPEPDAAAPDAPAPPDVDTAADGGENGTGCGGAAGCRSGFCVAGVCCDSACPGPCRACTAERTGVPDGTCAPVLAGKPGFGCAVQDPRTCGGDGMCDGAGACRLYPDGTVCGGICCNAGPGGPKPCTFVCRRGACDSSAPIPQQACPILQCCCEAAGAASCKPPGACLAPGCLL